MSGSSLRPEIVQAVDHITRHRISLIEGPTGSGKSSLIPTFLSSTIAEPEGKVVMVALPTIEAVKGLYARVKDKTGGGYKVGYSANRIIRYNLNEDTLVYATSGHVRRLLSSFFSNGKLKETKKVLRIGYLILDEVHTGSVDNTFIMGLWDEIEKELKGEGPRLVLMSATINGLPDAFKNQPRFELVMKSFNVKIEYLKENPKDNCEAVDIAVDEALKFHRNKNKKGNIIIFVAGIHDIERAETRFSNTGTIGDSGYEIITVHSSIKKNRKPSQNKRLIYIATNALESSVTIDNVEFVIDTMYEKKPEKTTNNGVKLVLTKISKNSADQRKGRAGRVMNGVCLRLITEESFRGLEQARPIDIFLIPIYSEVLSILSTGLSPAQILSPSGARRDVHDILPSDTKKPSKNVTELLTSLAKPKENTLVKDERVNAIVEDARDYLMSLKLISKEGKPVAQAVFLSSLQIGLRSGMIIIEWLRHLRYDLGGTLDMRRYYLGIIVSCLIDDDPRSYTDSLENFRPFLGRNDLETLINMWQNLMIHLDYKTKNQFQLIRDWCFEHKFKIDAIDHLVKTFNDCVNAVNANIYKHDALKGNEKFDPLSAANIGLSDLELDIMNDVISVVFIDDMMKTYKDKRIILKRLTGKQNFNFISQNILPQRTSLDTDPFVSKEVVPLSFHYNEKGQMIISAYIVREKFAGKEEDVLTEFSGYDPGAFD